MRCKYCSAWLFCRDATMTGICAQCRYKANVADMQRIAKNLSDMERLARSMEEHAGNWPKDPSAPKATSVPGRDRPKQEYKMRPNDPPPTWVCGNQVFIQWQGPYWMVYVRVHTGQGNYTEIKGRMGRLNPKNALEYGCKLARGASKGAKND